MILKIGDIYILATSKRDTHCDKRTVPDVSKVAKYIDESEYDIDFFYNICGTNDTTAYWSHSAAAKNITLYTDKLINKKNYLWMEKSGGHDFNIWYLGFYNFAKTAFNPDIPEE